MSELAAFFDVTNPVEDPRRRAITDMVMAWHNATPRHLQVELGPSEVGHPCMRKIAYGTMQADECNPQFDPLPSIIGTASHAWMHEAAEHANRLLGRTRWLAEQRVEVAPGLGGSCDLFDLDTGAVIDHKFPGANRFTMYKKKMSTVYRNQVHLYGYGFEQAGHTVNTVSVALFPRGGMLRNMHLWTEPYSRSRAETVLEDRLKMLMLTNDLDVERNPERFRWIPASPDDCRFCAWYSPTADSPLQCKGDGT